MRPRRIILLCLVWTIALAGCRNGQGGRNGIVPSGHPDIDQVRMEIQDEPTNPDNLKERVGVLRMWIRLLSFSGADLNPIRTHFMEHNLHLNVSDLEGSKEKSCQAVDTEFRMLENIFREFSADPDQYLMDLERDQGSSSGELRDWPTLRGDEGQTGFTSQSGPLKGELKWKFPAGHAWYATPAFDGDRVYIGSPGVSYVAYALDDRTGSIIWKTPQKENQNQYRTPRSASPALIAGDQVIVREIGSGGNNRASKHFVFIDKHTGRETREIYAGHVDYRVGHAPVESNGEFLVYPHSIQEIGSGGDKAHVKVVSFDSLVCSRIRDGERIWNYYMGEFYAEPLIVGGKVFCGNYSGEFKCLDLTTGNLAWSRKTGSPVNVKAIVEGDLVIVSNQAGKVMAFHASDGEQAWETLLPAEEKSFQLFSNPLVRDGSLYLGSATRHLYCLDIRSGEVIWQKQLGDWIRSAPVMAGDLLVAATCNGSLYGIDPAGPSPEIRWEERVSTHGIYADLKTNGGSVYVSSSDLYLAKVDPADGRTEWKTSIFESVPGDDGTRILADLTGGGPDYQAGTTVADGIAYFGSPRFVYAVDVETGLEVWKYETRGQICGAPAVDNGKVFFGQQGGTGWFNCVDAKTGRPLWRTELGWVWASPNVKEGKVYIAAVGGNFFCCDQETGVVLWSYNSAQGAYPAPSFKGDKAYFGSWNGFYYAFDKDSGELIWKFDIEGHPDSGSSMVKDSTFYAQGYLSKYFFALDALTGKERWKVHLDGEWCNASPATDGDYVLYSTYVGGPLHQAPLPSHTFCLQAATGEQVYTIPFAGGLTGAAICNELVFAASSTDSYIRAWDIATGDIRWQYRTGGRAEETCMTIYGDMALVVCTDGYLYAFE